MAWDGGSGPRRVFVEDARGNGQFLRVTWHADRQQFVFSNWDESVCVGATRVQAADAATLAQLLVTGLADAATTNHPVAGQPLTLADHLPDLVAQPSAQAPVVTIDDEVAERRRRTA